MAQPAMETSTTLNSSPKKVRALDLVGIALEIFDPFVQGGGLKLRGLSVEDAEVAGHDVLVDEIDPDPGLSSLVGISWYQAGLVLRVSIFEEFEDDLRIVKRFPLICESGNQPFGIEGQQSGVLVERIGLYVFVRYPAFLESNPTFVREWAEPTTI